MVFFVQTGEREVNHTAFSYTRDSMCLNAYFAFFMSLHALYHVYI
jgi:hypothetical protein